MALNYHPRPGEIVLCNFETGFVAPEMVKRRPVVIVSPRLRGQSGLATVIPLSTTEPKPALSYHVAIELAPRLPHPFGAACVWAKCGMIATVSFARLDRFRSRHGSGARTYSTGQLTQEQLKAVQVGMLAALGLHSLTLHL